LPAGVDVEIKM